MVPYIPPTAAPASTPPASGGNKFLPEEWRGAPIASSEHSVPISIRRAFSMELDAVESEEDSALLLMGLGGAAFDALTLSNIWSRLLHYDSISYKSRKQASYFGACIARTAQAETKAFEDLGNRTYTMVIRMFKP